MKHFKSSILFCLLSFSFSFTFVIVYRSSGPQGSRRKWQSLKFTYYFWVQQMLGINPIGVEGYLNPLISSEDSIQIVLNQNSISNQQLPYPFGIAKSLYNFLIQQMTDSVVLEKFAGTIVNEHINNTNSMEENNETLEFEEFNLLEIPVKSKIFMVANVSHAEVPILSMILNFPRGGVSYKKPEDVANHNSPRGGDIAVMSFLEVVLTYAGTFSLLLLLAKATSTSAFMVQTREFIKEAVIPLVGSARVFTPVKVLPRPRPMVPPAFNPVPNGSFNPGVNPSEDSKTFLGMDPEIKNPLNNIVQKPVGGLPNNEKVPRGVNPPESLNAVPADKPDVKNPFPERGQEPVGGLPKAGKVHGNNEMNPQEDLRESGDKNLPDVSPNQPVLGTEPIPVDEIDVKNPADVSSNQPVDGAKPIPDNKGNAGGAKNIGGGSNGANNPGGGSDGSDNPSNDAPNNMPSQQTIEFNEEISDTFQDKREKKKKKRTDDQCPDEKKIEVTFPSNKEPECLPEETKQQDKNRKPIPIAIPAGEVINDPNRENEAKDKDKKKIDQNQLIKSEIENPELKGKILNKARHLVESQTKNPELRDKIIDSFDEKRYKNNNYEDSLSAVAILSKSNAHDEIEAGNFRVHQGRNKVDHIFQVFKGQLPGPHKFNLTEFKLLNRTAQQEYIHNPDILPEETIIPYFEWAKKILEAPDTESFFHGKYNQRIFANDRLEGIVRVNGTRNENVVEFNTAYPISPERIEKLKLESQSPANNPDKKQQKQPKKPRPRPANKLDDKNQNQL